MNLKFFLCILGVFFPTVFLAENDNVSSSDNTVTKESRRTVIINHSKDLESLFSGLTEEKSKRDIQTLIRIIRQGENKLINVDPQNETLYKNARNLALKKLAAVEAVTDKRAVRARERAGDDFDKLIKIIERYPHTQTAVDILLTFMNGPHKDEVFRQWSELIVNHPLLRKVKHKSTKKPIYLPSSEKHATDIPFELPMTGKLVFQRAMFLPPPKQVNRFRPDNPVIALYPLDFFNFDRHGLTISGYRGVTRFEMSDPIKQYIYTPKQKLLNHLDNNLIGDITQVNNDLYITSQRHSPLIKDSQKDLYVVELSRHYLCAFNRNEKLTLFPEKKRTYHWKPTWSLQSDVKTFNSSVSVRGSRAYATNTSLSGLFNSELTCFDVNNGNVVWERSLASGQHELNYFGRYIREAASGIPLVTDDIIYVSTNFGTIHALDLDGRPLWCARYNRIPTPIPIQYYAKVNPRLSRFRNQMPRLWENNLYVSPTDCDAFICFNAKTGEKKWQFNLNPNFKNPYPHHEFWAKTYWYVDEYGITILNKNKLILLDHEGKQIREKKLPYLGYYLGRPLWCQESIIFASGGFLTVVRREDFEILSHIDLKKFGIRFDQANLFYNGTHLAIINKNGELFYFVRENVS